VSLFDEIPDLTREASVAFPVGDPLLTARLGDRATEAEILTAMASASPEEQQRLVVRLDEVRGLAVLASVQDRQVASYEAEHGVRTAHVASARSSEDWTGGFESPAVDPGIMKIEARFWYRGLDPFARSDPDEIVMRARHQAALVAGPFGVNAAEAHRIFVDEVRRLANVSSGGYRGKAAENEPSQGVSGLPLGVSPSEAPDPLNNFAPVVDPINADITEEDTDSTRAMNIEENMQDEPEDAHAPGKPMGDPSGVGVSSLPMPTGRKQGRIKTADRLFARGYDLGWTDATLGYNHRETATMDPAAADGYEAGWSDQTTGQPRGSGFELGAAKRKTQRGVDHCYAAIMGDSPEGFEATPAVLDQVISEVTRMTRFPRHAVVATLTGDTNEMVGRFWITPMIGRAMAEELVVEAEGYAPIADPSGVGVSGLPQVDETTPDVMWPWEIDDDGDKGAADVASVSTPGDSSGYPQPKAAQRKKADGGVIGPAFLQEGDRILLDGEVKTVIRSWKDSRSDHKGEYQVAFEGESGYRSFHRTVDIHLASKTSASKSDECPKCGTKTDTIMAGDKMDDADTQRAEQKHEMGSNYGREMGWYDEPDGGGDHDDYDYQYQSNGGNVTSAREAVLVEVEPSPRTNAFMATIKRNGEAR